MTAPSDQGKGGSYVRNSKDEPRELVERTAEPAAAKNGGDRLRITKFEDGTYDFVITPASPQKVTEPAKPARVAKKRGK